MEVRENYGWVEATELEDHRYNFRSIKKILPPSCKSILDVGCGTGVISAKLAALGYEVIGLDASDDGVALARKAFPEIRFEKFSVYDDLTQLLAEPVDLVVSCEVIEHLYAPRKFLHNITEILKPGGHIILTTPYHGYLKNFSISVLNGWDKHFTVDWEGGHIKFFSQRTLRKLLEDCDFRDIRFANAGRVRWLWKSMVCRAEKPAKA